MLHQFIGPHPVIYPAIVIAGKVLTGIPGDKPVEFGDVTPPDDRWAPVNPLADDATAAAPAPAKPAKNAKES